MYKILKSTLFFFVGIILYAIGVKLFALPHKIAPGGASGLAVLINYVTSFPVGLFITLFNIPLILIVCIKKIYNKQFIIKTTICVLVLSAFMEGIQNILPPYEGDTLLATIFGGVFMGIGLALVHLANANTGGLSLLAVIIKKYYPQFEIGVLSSLLNSIVVVLSWIVYRNIESVLYSIIIVYISGVVMDSILEQTMTKHLMIVISECTDSVRQIFLDERKGITILNGEGGYLSNKQRVIICAINKSDCFMIKEEIEKIDPNALIIICKDSRVSGKNLMGYRMLE